jgi:hypothetical protein
MVGDSDVHPFSQLNFLSTHDTKFLSTQILSHTNGAWVKILIHNPITCRFTQWTWPTQAFPMVGTQQYLTSPYPDFELCDVKV